MDERRAGIKNNSSNSTNSNRNNSEESGGCRRRQTGRTAAVSKKPQQPRGLWKARRRRDGSERVRERAMKNQRLGVLQRRRSYADRDD
jgi:hypothetical protein